MITFTAVNFEKKKKTRLQTITNLGETFQRLKWVEFFCYNFLKTLYHFFLFEVFQKKKKQFLIVFYCSKSKICLLKCLCLFFSSVLFFPIFFLNLKTMTLQTSESVNISHNLSSPFSHRSVVPPPPLPCLPHLYSQKILVFKSKKKIIIKHNHSVFFFFSLIIDGKQQ